MCDTSPVRNWLVAALVAALAAVAAIAVAALLNASFWKAPESPEAMLIGAAFTAAAMGACIAALSSLDTVCACLAPQCIGQCANLRTLIYATQVVLGIQATAAVGAALPALIPLAGIEPMKVIAGALAVQVVLLGSHILFVAGLDDCAARAAADNGPAVAVVPGTSSSGLTVSSAGRWRGFSWRRLWKRFRR